MGRVKAASGMKVGTRVGRLEQHVAGEREDETKGAEVGKGAVGWRWLGAG